MSGILDDLAEDVAAALDGELRTATYWRSQIVGDDGYGNPVYGWTSYSCQGTRGSYDAAYAGLSGIPRTDSRIEIIAATLAVAPQNLDRIFIESAWWVVTKVETDPATAVWVMQCSSSTDPNA